MMDYSWSLILSNGWYCYKGDQELGDEELYNKDVMKNYIIKD